MASIIKVTLTINETVERIWELFMNPDNLKHWLTGFGSVEHIKGRVGEIGSVSKLKFMERGKEMEIMETVLDSKPNQRYTFSMKHTTFETETDVHFISFGNFTEMIQTVQFSPKGFFMKLLGPLIKGSMKNRMAKELMAFKKFVESKP